jgi:hypothetical protein
MIRLKSKLQRVGAAVCVLASWLAVHSPTALAQTTLSVTPASIAPGSTVTATWSGIALPTATNWIGLHLPGVPSQQYVDWMYVSCSKVASAVRPASNCAFPIPAGLANGNYELRLHASSSWNAIAKSNALSVASGGGGGTPATTNVVQFLTHDNSSAPTNRAWNHILGFPWKRGIWGDWLDAQQKPFGVSTTGALPYASVAVPQPGRYSVVVTPLVQRWMANSENRGLYLRMRANLFAIQFAGRASANAAARPKLSVTTTTGTYVLDARCNATLLPSSSYPNSRADQWSLGSQAVAILHFDLAAVKGNVTQATFSFTDLSHAIGSTSSKGIIDVFEADPPRFVVPDEVASPALGIGANYPSFQSLATDSRVLFSDDFASPGWADKGFVHPVERVLNPQTGTTYARAQYVAGSNSSASIYKDVVRGTGPNGSPDKVVPELFGQYHLYLEKDFGSTVDGMKLPGMSVQYGYWTQVGYWQPISGNGGSIGTGLKSWNAAQNRWEYRGHSVRSLISKSPADESAYGNLFSLALYPYSLDQVGPYPLGEAYAYIALRRERWYTMDLQLKQNSIIPPYDSVGNGTAVADGVCRLWINGLLVYQKSTFRWRRHPEFGVQGIWMDFYHGGIQPAPYTMHYRLDRVSLATSYIGPLRR